MKKETELKERIAEMEDPHRAVRGELNDLEKTNKYLRQKLEEEESRSSARESRIACLQNQVAEFHHFLEEQLRQQNRSEEDIFQEASWSCEADETGSQSFTPQPPLSQTESGTIPSLTLREELGDLYESDCSATESGTSDTHGETEQRIGTGLLIEQDVEPFIFLPDERRLLDTSTSGEDVWPTPELNRRTSKE